jgi:hypothetical protein
VKIELQENGTKTSIHYTEGWSVNQGKITLDGDDNILHPDGSTGKMKVSLKAWFITGKSLKSFGLEPKGHPSAGVLKSKEGVVNAEFIKKPFLKRTVIAEWTPKKTKKLEHKVVWS